MEARYLTPAGVFWQLQFGCLASNPIAVAVCAAAAVLTARPTQAPVDNYLKAHLQQPLSTSQHPPLHVHVRVRLRVSVGVYFLVPSASTYFALCY